jgi:hypothetical protein
MKILTFKRANLNKIVISKIISLKNKEWKYGLKSHLIWFKKKIKRDDIHICILKKNDLVGYNCLRKRSLIINNKKYKFFFFDTFIIDKEHREKNLSKKILYKNYKIFSKEKLPSILLCKKKLINFYKKNGWFLLDDKKRFFFKDFKSDKYMMIYSKQSFLRRIFLAKKIILFLNK